MSPHLNFSNHMFCSAGVVNAEWTNQLRMQISPMDSFEKAKWIQPRPEYGFCRGKIKELLKTLDRVSKWKVRPIKNSTKIRLKEIILKAILTNNSSYEDLIKSQFSFSSFSLAWPSLQVTSQVFGLARMSSQYVGDWEGSIFQKELQLC